MARIVLVHGAFSGAWSWEPVLPGLTRGGSSRCRRSTCPATARTTRRSADVTLDAYADTRVLGARRGTARGAGRTQHGRRRDHAGGGAAARSGSRRWCTWRRSCPADGQSLLDLTQLPEGAGDQVQANLVVDGDPPVATMPPDAARTAIHGCADDEAAAWAVARRGPQPVAPFGQPVRIEPANREAFEAATARVRDVPAGPRDPAGASAANVRDRRLRSRDRDRHRPRADAVAHRRDARGARPARPVARAGGRPGRLTPI